MNSNPELELAWNFIETTDTSLFLTGKAGTGKTTFLRNLKEKCSKRMVVLAPTGIAAINAGGVTIHSFFQLPFSPYIPESSYSGGDAQYKFQYRKERVKIIKSIDLLVIDEISMVRADLLDAVDNVLRKFRDREKPFGGVQLLMIGDLQQLPPVVKEDDWDLLRPYYDSMYFFSSNALKKLNYFTIELKEVYRQTDRFFLDILNKIRENRCDKATIDELNRRYVPGFNPSASEGYIRLTTHNHTALDINAAELAKINSREYTFRATITGKFPAYSFPTDEELRVKKGAQIMFVKNGESEGIRYYNGMLGKIVDIDSSKIVVIKNDEDIKFELKLEEWTNARYVLNDKTKEIVEEIEGTFVQYPIKLAWAITIHKSQGLTFEKAVIDAAASFSHGQAYVALSRCKSLEGLVLSSPLSERAIICDKTVDNFISNATAHLPSERQLSELQRLFYLNLLTDLFSFTQLEYPFRRLTRLLDEHLYRMYPQLLNKYKEYLVKFEEEIVSVARKFGNQYLRLLSENSDYENDSTLSERIAKGADYFKNKLAPLFELVDESLIEIDNADLKKRFVDALTEFNYNLNFKYQLMGYVVDNGLKTSSYVNKKAVLSISVNENLPKKKSSRIDNSSSSKSVEKSDIKNPQLYEHLVEWRKAEAARQQLPVYTIVQTKALIRIANNPPSTMHELLSIPYFGKKTCDKYGDAILDIVEGFVAKKTLFSD